MPRARKSARLVSPTMKEASQPDSRTLGIFGRSVALLAAEEDESVFQAAMEEIRPIPRRGLEIPLAFERMENARPLQTPTIPMRAGGYVG